MIGQYFSDDSSTTLSDTEAKVDYSLSRKKYHGDIKEQIPQRVRSISNPYHTVSKPSELDAPPASPPIITKCGEYSQVCMHMCIYMYVCIRIYI